MNFLDLTHAQYDELQVKRMELSHICRDGSVDVSDFLGWVIEKYGLAMNETYHIRVAPEATKEEK